MKEVSIPIVDGKYSVAFPKKCVYCGAPREKVKRALVSAGSSRRTRYVTVDVPYCVEHARRSRRNSRILNLGLVTTLIFSCCVLFSVTTSINRTPPVWLMVFLAFVAVGLAFLGSRGLRRLLARSDQTMADMLGRSHLGVNIELSGDGILFSFTNDEVADEFARVNGQVVSA